MKKTKKKRLERLHRRKEERKERREERLRASTALFSGTISVARGGFGFVKPDPEQQGAPEQDVFIPAKYTGNAMDGDQVQFCILPPDPRFYDDSKGPAGRVVSVEARAHERLIGEVIAGGRVRPLNRRLLDDVAITGGKKLAARGDWVELKLSPDSPDGGLSGRIVRSLGAAGTIQSDLDAVCAEYGIAAPYTEEQDREFSEITPREIAREDMSKAFTLTIDPADAKDFDDALSIAGLPDGNVQIGVHIADVAAFVAPGSKLDKEAAKRGFTAYLPGRTLPMLPKSLTAKISLQEGVKSPAHSVLLTVDVSTGAVLASRRCHSLIRNDRRMNYDEVQQYIESGKAPKDWGRDLKKNLGLLLKTTRAMRAHRRAMEDFLDLALSEIRVLADENADRISGLEVRKQKEAEFIVEECMLAANSAVGMELVTKQIPGLFRIHNEPEPEKIEEFSYDVESAFGIYPGDLTSRKNCNRFIASLPDDERKPVILSLLLRSLPRAAYSEEPLLHFGLGKTRYCHFTSPIRRYTDLAVHQQLWNADKNQRLKSKSSFARLALDLSAKEENNDNAFFSAGDRLKLRYLHELLEAGGGNFYEAVVFKVTAAGLVIELPELGLHGFIQLDDLPGEFRKHDNMLHSVNGKKSYKPGDFIYVKLYDIDPIRGQALFRPAGQTLCRSLSFPGEKKVR